MRTSFKILAFICLLGAKQINSWCTPVDPDTDPEEGQRYGSVPKVDHTDHDHDHHESDNIKKCTCPNGFPVPTYECPEDGQLNCMSAKTLKLTEQETAEAWNPKYADKTSDEYKAVTDKLITEISKKTHGSCKPRSETIKITGARSSVASENNNRKKRDNTVQTTGKLVIDYEMVLLYNPAIMTSDTAIFNAWKAANTKSTAVVIANTCTCKNGKAKTGAACDVSKKGQCVEGQCDEGFDFNKKTSTCGSGALAFGFMTILAMLAL